VRKKIRRRINECRIPVGRRVSKLGADIRAPQHIRAAHLAKGEALPLPLGPSPAIERLCLSLASLSGRDFRVPAPTTRGVPAPRPRPTVRRLDARQRRVRCIDSQGALLPDTPASGLSRPDTHEQARCRSCTPTQDGLRQSFLHLPVFVIA
jgi:hypothetical protein